MFGISLLGLGDHHHPDPGTAGRPQDGPAVMVPMLSIVLGPLGQSITAAGNLGTQAARVLPAPYATSAAVFALLYGMPVWGSR
jgi:hypothetical protein